MLNTNYWNQIRSQWRYLPLLIIFILFTGESKAAYFQLSFDIPTGSELTMSLQGDLQADNNSVIVTDINTVKVDGVAQSLQTSVFDSYTSLVTGVASPAQLSLDSTMLDFVFCSSICSANPIDWFVFISDPNSTSATYVGNGIFGDPNDDAIFDTQGNNTSLPLGGHGYKLVPEPQALSLLLIGFAVLSHNSRRQRKSSIASEAI